MNECSSSGIATPAKVLGMSGITAPTETTVGSGDLPNPLLKKKKKMKSLKDYMKQKL